MKKRVFILVAIFLLILCNSFFILAQEDSQEKTTEQPAIPQEETLTKDSSIEKNLKNSLENPKEILLPENIQKILKNLFKLKEVKFSEAIMLCGLLILVILILQQALSAGLENKLTAWIVAVLLSLIGAVSGGFQYGLGLWQKLGEITKLAKEASVFWMSFGIILLLIAYILLKLLGKQANKAVNIENARELGRKLGLIDAKNRIRANQ